MNIVVALTVIKYMLELKQAIQTPSEWRVLWVYCQFMFHELSTIKIHPLAAARTKFVEFAKSPFFIWFDVIEPVCKKVKLVEFKSW